MKIQYASNSFPGVLSGVAQLVQSRTTCAMASASNGLLLESAFYTLKTPTLVKIATAATICPMAFVSRME